MKRKILIAAISLTLLFFFCVPLAIIAYGSMGGLVSGFLLLAPLIGMQAFIMKSVRQIMPSCDADAPEGDD